MNWQVVSVQQNVAIHFLGYDGMIKKFISLVIIGWGFIFVASSSVSAASIINGSFEDLTGLTMTGGTAYGNGVPVGWSYTSAATNPYVQVLNTGFYPVLGVDGNFYVEYGSGFGTLSQNVTGLSVGQDYELSFLWGNRLGNFDITVEMGGASFNAVGTGLTGMTSQSLFFSALATDLDLGITWNRSTQYSGAHHAFVLSEVSAVPLPPLAILFGTALLGLAGLRRRKRKAA